MISLIHVLYYVTDVAALLNKCMTWLSPGGRIIICLAGEDAFQKEIQSKGKFIISCWQQILIDFISLAAKSHLISIIFIQFKLCLATATQCLISDTIFADICLVVNGLINPLSPDDALKHHFTFMKRDLLFLQQRVLERKFP